MLLWQSEIGEHEHLLQLCVCSPEGMETLRGWLGTLEWMPKLPRRVRQRNPHAILLGRAFIEARTRVTAEPNAWSVISARLMLRGRKERCIMRGA